MTLINRHPLATLAALLVTLALASSAFADDAADARKTLESFVTAYQTGDEKSLRDQILPPAPATPAAAFLDTLAATARLRKAAIAKFGESASDFFLGASAATTEARNKSIRQAPVKFAGGGGHSAFLSLPADEKNNRPAQSLLLVKSNGSWKIDANSLFNLDASVDAATAPRVAVALRLTALTDAMTKDLAADKYPDAIAALLDFWSRAKDAARPTPPITMTAAATPTPAAPAKLVIPNTQFDLSPAARALSDKDITPAINKAAETLLASLAAEMSRLKTNRLVGPMGEHEAFGDETNGQIALSVYAILTAGRVSGNPRFRSSSKDLLPAIDYLAGLDCHYNYSVALQALALSLLPNKPQYRKALTAVRDELLQGSARGIYTYYDNRHHDTGDNSNTQYGQLGVWACQDTGLETPNSYWTAVDQYWRKTQGFDGGWGYIATLPNYSTPVPGIAQQTDLPRPSMTAAAVASLFLAQEYLDRSVNLEPRPDKNLDTGITWLSDHIGRTNLDYAADLYLAFSIERVALAGGLKHLGQFDWYREGAVSVLAAQKPDNSWNYEHGSPAVGTSYALLFLSRGIAPIAFGKLRYEGPWNARARDCARFVHWLDKKTERTLNWQVIPINSDPADWRTPVLVISGHGDPNFSPENIATLRRYILNGGLVLSTADGGDAAFTNAIRNKYAPAIFNNLYEMRNLPDSHPVFQLDFKIKPPNKLHLFGLSNGVREVWIHSQEDLGAAWQSYSTAQTDYFEVPANIYFYAMGRSSAPLKLEPLDPPIPPKPTAALNIALLSYAGNPDPEPAAWPRFITECRLHHGTVINAIDTPIDQLDAAKTPIAHITGTTAFTLTDRQRNTLLDFFKNGGMLLADSTAGSDAFSASFKSACETLFPDSPLQPLPENSPILTGADPGYARINDLEHRRFSDMPENRGRSLALQQILHGNKTAVIFSPGDLTAGLAGLRTWGIHGYSIETATALAWNSLLFLSTQSQPPAAPRAPADISDIPAPPPPLEPTPTPTPAPASPAPPPIIITPKTLTETYTTLSTPLNLMTFPH